jgi:hypothetical protein
MPWVREEKSSKRPEGPRETRLNRIGLIRAEILAAFRPLRWRVAFSPRESAFGLIPGLVLPARWAGLRWFC